MPTACCFLELFTSCAARSADFFLWVRRSKVAQTSLRRRSEVAQTSLGRLSEAAQKLLRRRSNGAQPSSKCRADAAQASLERRSNIAEKSLESRPEVARKSLGSLPQTTQKSLRRRSEVTQNSPRSRSNIARTSLGHRSDGAQESLTSRRGTARRPQTPPTSRSSEVAQRSLRSRPEVPQTLDRGCSHVAKTSSNIFPFISFLRVPRRHFLAADEAHRHCRGHKVERRESAIVCRPHLESLPALLRAQRALTQLAQVAWQGTPFKTAPRACTRHGVGSTPSPSPP